MNPFVLNPKPQPRAPTPNLNPEVLREAKDKHGEQGVHQPESRQQQAISYCAADARTTAAILEAAKEGDSLDIAKANSFALGDGASPSPLLAAAPGQSAPRQTVASGDSVDSVESPSLGARKRAVSHCVAVDTVAPSEAEGVGMDQLGRSIWQAVSESPNLGPQSPSSSPKIPALGEAENPWEARRNILDASHALNLDAPVEVGDMKSDESHRALLYNRFILKCQKLQTVTFATGGVIFTLGSVFFFPQMGSLHGQRLVHGCWLYLSGSLVFLFGAWLGKNVGQELLLTGQPLKYNFARGKHRHHLYWMSDEQINVLSCDILIWGTVLFVLGTVLFFPGFPESITPYFEYVACILFLAGSCCFVGSAVVDYLRLHRSYSKYTYNDDMKGFGTSMAQHDRQQPLLHNVM